MQGGTLAGNPPEEGRQWVSWRGSPEGGWQAGRKLLCGIHAICPMVVYDVGTGKAEQGRLCCFLQLKWFLNKHTK